METRELFLNSVSSDLFEGGKTSSGKTSIEKSFESSPVFLASVNSFSSAFPPVPSLSALMALICSRFL